MITALRFRIISDSMEPLLKVGDEIVWEKIEKPFENLERFDLILFRQNQNLYCHFLWKIDYRQRVFVTRAYRYLWHEDLPLTQNQILGKVTNYQLSLRQKLKIIFYFLVRRRS